MLNQAPLRLVRLALLRARVARCCSGADEAASFARLDQSVNRLLLPSPRLLVTDASAAAASSAPSSDQSHQQQYREYDFALTPQHRRVTIVAAAHAALSTPTPVVVSTSDDPERIVIRAPIDNGQQQQHRHWAVQLGPHGPEAREEEASSSPPLNADHQHQQQPPAPPPPIQVLLPPRFCGLDVVSTGGDVTVTGSGVQEADVRITVVATAPPDSLTTTTNITATRLRCGDLLLDAGPRGRITAKELAASRLEARAGGGVELGRVSALRACIEAGESLDVGAMYGRAVALRLQGGATASGSSLPLLRVNQLSCGGAGDEHEHDNDNNNNSNDDLADLPEGATLEAWPSGAIAVRVDGSLAGTAVVASGGGPVTLAAVQASGGGLRSLIVDSGGGDVDVSLDTGASSAGGRGGGAAAPAAPAAAAYATVRVANTAGFLSVDPALGLDGSDANGHLPVYGAGSSNSSIAIDAGGRGRVTLRARSWMDGVMARAKEAAAARGGGSGRGGR